MNMARGRVFNLALIVFGFLIVGCKEDRQAQVRRLPDFHITNIVAGGQLRQVINVTNGISLYFTESNLVVWFCKDSDLILNYSAVDLRPESVMLEMPEVGAEPAQATWDINADGVPEFRRIRGQETNEILFRGEWYPKVYVGTNLYISVDGKAIKIGWDGHRFVEAQ